MHRRECIEKRLRCVPANEHEAFKETCQEKADGVSDRISGLPHDETNKRANLIKSNHVNNTISKDEYPATDRSQQESAR